jgi:NAD(P) transhydrogenase
VRLLPEFDLVVIGSGPAGQKAAISAAKQRKKVAVIDKLTMVGGVCVHTGTIPSKALREAIIHLTSFLQRTSYGRDFSQRVSIKELAFRVNDIISRETQVIRAQLGRNGVQVFEGAARFLDPHVLEVTSDRTSELVRGEYVVIACGTRPAHAPNIPFDGIRIIDTDQIAKLEEVPREMIVVGGGVVGIECASFFAALGAKVTLIEARDTILDFIDHEIVEALMFHLRRLGVVFRLGEKVTTVGIDERDRVYAGLESGKRAHGDSLLYAVGRQANGDLLELEAAGLKCDPRGKVAVNEYFQTTVPHIFAAGDVIGFPALASTSMEQGRLASVHIFGGQSQKMSTLLPYGIYTIPEVSVVGATEQALTAAKTPYEIGIARYAELAKSMMLGDDSGMLKILFHPETLKVLGVHAMGDRATEIIHIGQAVIAFGGTIEYFRDAVFNYPTLAEAYKVAALDGFNRL